ncbi:MAG: hypothetical protein AAGI17_11320 [Planctomycetota bacterium]
MIDRMPNAWEALKTFAADCLILGGLVVLLLTAGIMLLRPLGNDGDWWPSGAAFIGLHADARQCLVEPGDPAAFILTARPTPWSRIAMTRQRHPSTATYLHDTAVAHGATPITSRPDWIRGPELLRSDNSTWLVAEAEIGPFIPLVRMVRRYRAPNKHADVMTRPHALGFPVWLAASAIIFSPVTFIARQLMVVQNRAIRWCSRQFGAPWDACPRCRYDLDGLPEDADRCPECGTRI